MKTLVAVLVGLALVPAAAQARLLGIAGTPQQFEALASMHPSVRAQYVVFGDSPSLILQADTTLQATAMFTWISTSTTLADIVAGDSDAYLRSTARWIRSYNRPVYIRFDQEMNGNWFPWSGDPTEYIAAWRHVWNVFHRAGASNVRWIFGPDLLSSVPLAQWESVAAYWPGSRYVNVLGPTMVEFAFETNCEVACRFQRIDWLHQRYHKPVWLAETKVDAAERYAWLSSLEGALATRPWVQAVIWSETPSRGQALGQAGTGDMDWSLTTDPMAENLLDAAIASS
jgi:beta-mannanase